MAGFWSVALQILLVVIATYIALRFAQITVNVALDRLIAREVDRGNGPGCAASWRWNAAARRSRG